VKKFRLLSGLTVLACAGAATAFGLAGPVGADTGTSTATSSNPTTTGSGKHSHKADKAEKANDDQGDKPVKTCRKVVLWGSDGAGSLTLTVAKASGRNNSALVGQPATLTVPANSTVHAVAVSCTDAPGVLTLKQLVVGTPHVAPSTSHPRS
jgi:hypothetical protein